MRSRVGVREVIHKMLDLSTAHVPAGTVDFGNSRWVAHEYGYVVFISPEDIPEWFEPIHRKAVENDCLLVNFDADGEESPDLETYQ